MKVYEVHVTWEEPCCGSFTIKADSVEEATEKALDLMRVGEYPPNESRCEPFGEDVYRVEEIKG